MRLAAQWMPDPHVVEIEPDQVAVDTVKQLSNLIPGMTYIKSLADDKAQKDYEGTVRNALNQDNFNATPFVRTNR